MKMDSNNSNKENKDLQVCVLHVTNACNLACPYCYANTTASGKIMNFSIIQRVLDGFLNRPSRPPQVDFHGGEPLLAFDQIKQTVEYANLLGVSDIRLFLQTNGTLLTDEVVSFIAEHGIDVGISLDGPEWINNQHRVFRDGSGSFQTVMQGINRLRAHQIDFKINCVVVDPSQLLEAFSFFQKAGFRKIKQLVSSDGASAQQPGFCPIRRSFCLGAPQGIPPSPGSLEE